LAALKRRARLLVEYTDGTFRVYEDRPDELRTYRAHDDETLTLCWTEATEKLVLTQVEV
jgi:hypothetical protein